MELNWETKSLWKKNSTLSLDQNMKIQCMYLTPTLKCVRAELVKQECYILLSLINKLHRPEF